MTTKRLLLSIGIVLALSGLGYWGYLQFLAPGTENGGDTAVSTPTSTTPTTITAEGQIVPLAQANLTFTSSGTVTAVAVQPGDFVEKGATLLTLDTAEQEIALRQAEELLVQAQANVQLAEAGVLAAETAVSAAEVGVSQAEANYALLAADPTEAQLVLNEALVSAAEANVNLAIGSQSVTLEGSSSAQIRAAEAAVAAAQAAYIAARDQYEPAVQDADAPADEREQAQLQLNAALANLQAAQAALDEALAGASSAEQIAAAGGVQAAQNEQAAAEAELALLQVGTQTERLAVASAEIQAAEEQWLELILQLEVAETAVPQAEAAVQEAQTQVDAAQLALEKRSLTAPFNGTVADVLVDVGEVVTAGQPVAIVADLSGWQVETSDLIEADVVAIARDDVARVQVDAFADQSLTGQIVEIAELAAEVRGDQTYVVTLALPKSELPLRWGMSVFITIERNQ
ncbi:MAG: HlyD family efflux transporter periplasmic adaptor subunit [Anaerolineales bacterium]|nr:HlyD family efflux transporter periplasmic adaptor subunit [Anaerolineales bacterium]MCB8937052.1 HlyD family efflux transporter periplasmic adaptor subunit [Ardenticatenaceae bacterium]